MCFNRTAAAPQPVVDRQAAKTPQAVLSGARSADLAKARRGVNAAIFAPRADLMAAPTTGAKTLLGT